MDIRRITQPDVSPPTSQSATGAARQSQQFAQRQQQVGREAGGAKSQEVLSPAEKDFFESLFPGAAAEVRSYHTYSPRGQNFGATAGSIVDRKG
jgi:hypothetical protein